MSKLITLGMLNWVHDIPEGSREIYINVLEILRKIPNPKILEVGTFTGTTITTIADMFPNANCTSIDNWSLEEQELQLCREVAGKFFTLEDVKAAFVKNTEGKNVSLIENDSTLALIDLIKQEQTYDFIYVDGSHRSLDTLLDLVLSWMLLPIGGILAIDDVLYSHPDNSKDNPREAVVCFLRKFKGQYTILNSGYRMFLQKKI